MPLPASLSFPATMATRTVLNLFPKALHPGVMVYGAAMTVGQWGSAKVRLGWLMGEIIKRLPRLFAQVDNRMRAFEASLFMIGYDVTCLGCRDVSSSYKASVVNVKNFQETLDCAAISSSALLKTLNTLSGNGALIKYTGDVSCGFHIQWGRQSFFLEPSVLEDLVSEFGGRRRVPLGAEQSGAGPSDSLGVWLKDAHKISPRFASVIAPVLAHAGIIRSHEGKRPIFLDFA
jgi:hypothetical protein